MHAKNMYSTKSHSGSVVNSFWRDVLWYGNVGSQSAMHAKNMYSTKSHSGLEISGHSSFNADCFHFYVHNCRMCHFCILYIFCM